MPFYSRYLARGIAFLAGLLVVGVTGFMTLEHETFLDAVLTTVSAISTVGYAPPHPLSAAGKVLAVILILGGLGGMAFVISFITEYLMAGHLHGVRERRRMEYMIGKLKSHFIISGFGRVGREVARTLVQAGDAFVVLDQSEPAVQTAAALGYLYYQGDASVDEVLRAVGIDRARGLIACADSDVNNVYVTLTARAVNPDIFIVARAAYPDAEPKLYKAGADRVVSPYVMAGRHMAQMAAAPALADYVNLLFDGTEIGVRILEIRAEEMPELVGRSVKELHDGILEGAFVLVIDRDGLRIDHVGPDELVEPHDRLLVVGSGAELQRLATIK